MKVITLDFESFWSQTHSLTKMSPLAYVMHPDTEIISCSLKIDDGPTRCVFGEDKLKKLFEKIDWSDVLLVAHNNSEFDSMIAAWRFGIKPKMWGCTLAMARPIYAKTVGLSLAKLGAALCPELGEKGSLEATNTKGKYLKDFTADELKSMGAYNNQDTEICYGVFKVLAKVTSPAEMRLIDGTIRMLVEPKFELDVPLLEKTLAAEQKKKHIMLLDVATMVGAYEAGMTDEEAAAAASKVLASAPKFSELLKVLGVPVPMKPSPSDPESGKMIPALAKTDQEFLDLQEHDDPIVAMAASARLGVKSTLLETRIEKFLEAGKWCGGLLPVPLRYYGADTTGRWSGWAYNPQNLPRVSGKSSDALRNSLRAPKGYKVVVADLSGIELRVNMFLWKVPYAMKLFQDSPDKADLYKYFAAHELYRIDESAVTKAQRQIGKIAHLGLGFGAGGPTFQKVAKSMGGVDMNEKEASDTVYKYRDAHPEIPLGWKTCHAALDYIHTGQEFVIDPWGMCKTSAEGIVTPQGIIRYPNLRKEKGDNGKDEWVYGEGRHKARIYAGKVTENIVQHLARGIIADNLLSIKKSTGHSPALSVHDELVYVVRDEDATALLENVQSFMRTPPTWWPELVTWSEGDIADTYGSAK
jgi:DNA polymerase